MKCATILCFFAFGLSAADEKIEFKSLPPGILEARLRLASPNINERFRRLKTLFEEADCPSLTEQKVKGSKQPNLICSIPAADSTAQKIIVGAHFDCAGGDGVIDNWTGAILMPSLQEFIKAKPRRHSFEFVGFAAEEVGLLGSQAYLRALKKDERKRIAAVITLDSLGLTPTKVWPNSSNVQLIRMAALVAQAMKLDLSGVNVEAVGTTDSATFHTAGIPVLSLHSVTQETWKLINSNQDVWQTLSWKDYYDSHRFVSALLVYLDQKLP